MDKSSRSHSRIHLIIAILALLVVLPILINETDLRFQFAAANSLSTDVLFSVPSGQYYQPINLRLTSSDPNAAIYFTTDGSLPTFEHGTLYTEPLYLPARPPRAVAVRAQAQMPDGSVGKETSATYFMNFSAELPIVSLITDPENLWGESLGIFAQPINRGRDWERQAEMFFYEPEQSSGFSAPVGIRVHGGRSRSDDKKSLRLYFRSEYGQPTVNYPIFPDSEKQIFKRLVLHNGGQDYPAVSVNATLLRNQLVGNLVREEGGLATYTRPVILFINGELWGIYNLRERVDSRYMIENYQINEVDLPVGFESELTADSGDLAHWQNLQEFIATHDLSNAENYAVVETQINIENFIDYSLFQIITANADWPHNNQLKFRNRSGGRWHWMFWDSDFAFGLMPDSYIDQNMFERVLGHDDELQQQAAMLLSSLLENPSFKTKFLSRLADLLNTVFIPDKVVTEIDQLASLMEQDIGYETLRWPGSGNWEAGVDYMREFAQQRPDIVRQQAVEFFDLGGTAEIVIEAFPSRQGSVSINNDDPISSNDLPWQGEFFHGVDIQLAALPASGYRFAGWDPPELPQTPVIAFPVSGDLTISPIFTKESDVGVQVGDVRIMRYGLAGGPSPVEGMEGDWIELQVERLGGVDLRGWRITDNDSKTAIDEGSLILGHHPALAAVPLGTSVLLVANQTGINDQLFPADDITNLNGRLLLYAGNGILDTNTDPWFALADNDNLVLLAPGESPSFVDDLAIDFVEIGKKINGVSAAAFGLMDFD